MDKELALKELGIRLRELRLSKGLTQTDLAYSIGKDHPSINRLENGKINPSYIFLCEVAKGLDVEVSELFKK